jgi:sortase A
MNAGWLLPWTRNALLITGFLSLGYCCFVLLDTNIYQAYQSMRFGQELNHAQTSLGSAREAAPAEAAIPGFALGKIEITRVGLTAMIMEGTDSRTLRRAVGHVRGTPLPGQHGNVAIAGHRDTFFRPLRSVHANDEITLTTLRGSYRYLVDYTQVVPPEDTEVLANSDDTTLTLVTCYPFYFVGPAPKRFVVRAHRIPEQ